MKRAVTPLRLAIVQSGRTQREIADEVGLTEPRMSLIVNGLHCDAALRARIAAAVGRDVADVFPGSQAA